jgi:uncharacterized protein YbbK (DUF523 family)
LIYQAIIFLHKHKELKYAILKSKSPSCGSGTTEVFNQNSKEITLGDGIAAMMMKEHGIAVYDENSFLDMDLL